MRFVGVPVRVGNLVHPAVVDELETAALFGEKCGVCARKRQKLQFAVVGRQRMLLEHLGRKAVGFEPVVEFARLMLQMFVQRGSDGGEAFEQQRVERAALAV